MFVCGCLFSGVARASGGLSFLFAGVGVVGVPGALKSPFRALRLMVLFISRYSW